MRVNFICYLILLAGISFPSLAQQTSKTSPAGTGYLEYLPYDYNSNQNKYPIVISLHGISEKGNTIADLAKVDNVSLAKYVKNGTQYPFIIISPQLKTSMSKWTGDYVMEVVNHVKSYLRINENRIYLAGLSLGGGGVWAVSSSYPDVFAAIIPICSGYNLISKACTIAEYNIPVWAFHGDADATVSYNVTANMINAINNCSPKPSPLAKLTIFPGLGHAIWDKVFLQTNVLDWMLSHSKQTLDSQVPVSFNPIADAGPNQTITLPANSLSISGSGSVPGGTITSYAWRKKSGGTVTMSNTDTPVLKVSNMTAGSYVFELTVTDNNGNKATDALLVNVNSAPISNLAPVANAGPNKTVQLPLPSVTINGSGSDQDGTVVSYQWRKRSGGAVTMFGINSKDLKVSNLAIGSYVFDLIVTDDKGSTAIDAMMLNVKAGEGENIAPIADAGPNKTVSLPVSSYEITGNATDSDGTINSYSWSKRSGGAVSMSETNTRNLKVSNLSAGAYVFVLTVKDDRGAEHSDAMLLNVVNPIASTGEFK